MFEQQWPGHSGNDRYVFKQADDQMCMQQMDRWQTNAEATEQTARYADAGKCRCKQMQMDAQTSICPARSIDRQMQIDAQDRQTDRSTDACTGAQTDGWTDDRPADSRTDYGRTDRQTTRQMCRRMYRQTDDRASKTNRCTDAQTDA
jgi:hypothetical protein